MLQICGSVGDSTRTSSAKRRLVTYDDVVKPSCSPYFLRAHVVFISAKMSSRAALNRSELSGSPCLTPRSIGNGVLIWSVRTVAVRFV